MVDTSSGGIAERAPHGAPSAGSPSNLVRAFIREAQVDVHVGLHPWEQHPERPTRLLVSVEMLADLADGHPASACFMDYDPIYAALRQWPQRPHTPLLETLADELIALCFSNPVVGACRVMLVKPDIFNDAGGVGIEVFRTRSNAA